MNNEETPKSNRGGVKMYLIVSALVLAAVVVILLAGCGGNTSLREVCSDRGGVAAFPPANDEEAYCRDGTEVENGDIGGWSVDD